MSDKRIITDRPELLGYMDGQNAVSSDTRTSRQEYIPDSQKSDYSRGWRDGAKDASKD